MINPKCNYPQYGVNFPDGLMRQVIDIAPKLLGKVGMLVRNSKFLSHINCKGVRIEGSRVYFDPEMVRGYIDQFVLDNKKVLKKSPPIAQQEWKLKTDGFSMMTLDVATDELRLATCDDLRAMIKLANSFGVDGYYMVMPQDVDPLLQAVACFKICFEMSCGIEPYDYQQAQQLPFLYEMHQVIGKPMDLVITIPSTMCIDPKDLDIFMEWYPVWKRERNINFRILDYPMVGVTKPLSIAGCAGMCFVETLATHILFHLFDPEIKLSISLQGGMPTDMLHACWAFGSPRAHLFRYLNSMILPKICELMPETYVINDWVALETSSPAIDEQAAMEKMACGLLAALQGARHFRYAGVLCVDDVYSGTQFVIDLEIMEYIKETINSFNPHSDILKIDGLYDECRDVALGNDTFLSSGNTASRVRNIIPSPRLIVREKLQSWMSHRTLLKDHAREIALDRIQNYQSYKLPADKQAELDRIYSKAESVLKK